MKVKLIVFIIIASLLSACTAFYTPPEKDIDTTNIDQLQKPYDQTCP